MNMNELLTNLKAELSKIEIIVKNLSERIHEIESFCEEQGIFEEQGLLEENYHKKRMKI